MNVSAQKFFFHLSRITNSNQFLNFSKKHVLETLNNDQKLIIRTVITRPKELDLMRKKIKDQEKESGEYRQKSSSEENIGLYGYFLLVKNKSLTFF